MSFSLSGAAPLARALDLPALLASGHVVRPAVAILPADPLRHTSPLACLAAAVLGRPGWREAALALGGSFDPDGRQPL